MIDMEDIILVGFGGHAKSVADAAERSGKFRIIGYTDREEHLSAYPYLGTDDVLAEYYQKGYRNLVICVGYLGKGDLRERLYQRFHEAGFSFPAIIDPSAVISESAVIGEGSFIGKRAVVNADAVIGKMCIINTGAIIEHECEVGDFAHISVGTVLCGQVKIGKAAFVGANATVIQCREIRERSIVPAGAVFRKEEA